jgi:S1-C subfamily serine protease
VKRVGFLVTILIVAFSSFFVLTSSFPVSPPSWAEKSIVVISAEIDQPILTFPFLPEPVTHSGTGFALAGHIYTCAHVIRGSKKITVTLRTGKKQEATLLRVDLPADLAELEIADMPPCLFLRAAAPHFFEKVWEIGNPGDLRFVTTTGYFLTFDGSENRFLIDTWFGNSGSPLMDTAGRVIGMAHNIIKGTRFTGGGTLQELQNFIHPERPR